MTVGVASAALLYTEDFSYVSGTNLVGQGAWGAHSGVGTNPVKVNSPGLTYSCYVGSGIGNAVGPLATSGEDVNHTFTPVTSGSAYAAAMINVTSASATGDYFFHVLTGTSSFYSRLYVRSSGGGSNWERPSRLRPLPMGRRCIPSEPHSWSSSSTRMSPGQRTMWRLCS